MDLFNKEKLEKIQKDFLKHKKSHKKDLETLNNKISSLEDSNSKLQKSLDKILDMLDSKSFSKDWEDFQKWKKMKDKLPNIEEMYYLKKLKELIIRQQKIIKEIPKQREHVVMLKTNSMARQILGQGRMIEEREKLNRLISETKSNKKEIENILKFLRKESKQKDLLEVFKLYAISTEWLQP